MTFAPIPFIDHSEHPQRNWQNFGNWATHFYALSAFATLLVVLAAAIFAMRQLQSMNRTQKLQVALRLFDEFKEIEKLASTRHLYENFCENKRFKLDIAGMSSEERKDITDILHTYAQIGAFVRADLAEGKFVVPLLAGVCVRMWIVLEEHIREERDRRQYPILYVTFEYLVVLCLIYILKNVSGKLVIYHPGYPDIPSYRRTYDTKDLLEMLLKLQKDVHHLGLDVPVAQIDISSEMTTSPNLVSISPSLGTLSPLLPPEQEDSTSVKSA